MSDITVQSKAHSSRARFNLPCSYKCDFLQKISPFKRMIQTVHSMVLFIAEQIERGLTFTKNLEYGEPFIGFVQVAYRIEFELLSCQDY